jgi:VWFA-related protein
MTRYLVTASAILTATLSLLAQTPPPATPNSTTLTTTTQLVAVDVIVQDRDGHPIHNLKTSDFQITEGKAPQTIKTFDEHAAATPTNDPPKPLRLPPGVFTDFTPTPADTTLNILLLDTLNTPTTAQSYVRNQLQEYLKHATPGARIAIFGLTNHLYFLQGFTSDPDILKNIAERKLLPRPSVLLADPNGTDPDSLTDAMATAGASETAVANMQQFEAQNAAFQTDLRTRYTLDAFNQLARYLGTFPGRKNLIWFSGSFPISIFPDATLNNPFAVQSDAGDEIRQTTNLLSQTRVAVYPIDARGLQVSPVLGAARSGSSYARNPGKMATDNSNFTTANALEHMTMSQIADDTGGHAFYNTNGLADAVSKSINAGSNYYTLTYAPTDRTAKGDYRSIHVQLQGEPATRSLQLSYRHGYFADDATHHTPPAPATPTTSPTTFSYATAAMQRGAPTPSEVLFKVDVRPDSTSTTDKIAPHNQPNPAVPVAGPFRLYDINFAVLGKDITMSPQPDGRRHGEVEFLAYVYNADGKLLNIDGQAVTMNLTPENYATLLKAGIGFQLQVSAPSRTDSFVRIAVHDIPSGHLGVVELPTSTLSLLPPQPPATPPASK